MSTKYKIVTSKTLKDYSGDNFFCSLCGFTLRSQDDFRVNSEYFCCHECYLTFVESRIEKWREGWRPKKSDIRKYINNRKSLIINAEKNWETQ